MRPKTNSALGNGHTRVRTSHLTPVLLFKIHGKNAFRFKIRRGALTMCAHLIQPCDVEPAEPNPADGKTPPSFAKAFWRQFDNVWQIPGRYHFHLPFIHALETGIEAHTRCGTHSPHQGGAPGKIHHMVVEFLWLRRTSPADLFMSLHRETVGCRRFHRFICANQRRGFSRP